MRTRCPGRTFRMVVGGGAAGATATPTMAAPAASMVGIVGHGVPVATLGDRKRAPSLTTPASLRCALPQSPCPPSSADGSEKTTFLNVTTPAALLSWHFLATAVTLPMTWTLLPGAGGAATPSPRVTRALVRVRVCWPESALAQWLVWVTVSVTVP